MVSKRVVVGVLAGVLMMSLIAGPAAGRPQTDRMPASDRAARVAAALQDGREGPPAGPGTFSALPGQPGGRTTVTEILTGVRNRRDLGNWLGGMADAITATSGATVAIAAPRTDGDGEAVAAADEDETEFIPYSGSWAFAYPAGDLDGDGRGDVVTYHYDLETWTVSLEAARGDNGAVLWARDDDADGGLAWPLQEDLTGDGVADLLVFSLDILTDSFDECWQSDEDEDCWNNPWEATFTWTVGLVSGRDGSTLWTRGLDGWIRESINGRDSSDPVAVGMDEEFSYEFAGENVYVLPFFADLDGSGTPEVILNAMDVADRFTATDSFVHAPVARVGRWEGGWELVSATRASVIDGTGAQLHQVEQAGPGRISLLWPLVHPDGTADVVWERAVYADTYQECVYADLAGDLEYCPVDEYGDGGFEVEVLDGGSFEPRWAKTVEAYGAVWPVDGDLDGDGHSDIVIWTLNWESWEDRADLLSGATGDALWDGDVRIRGVLAAGPLDNVPGDDVVAVDYDWVYDEDSATYTMTVHFQRRNGVTGELLGQTSHTATDRPVDSGYDVEMLYATSGPDGSGDGALDLTVGKVVWQLREDEDDPDWFTFEFGDSSAVAESGATGEQLYAFADAGYRTLRMAGDFDGDGLTEAVQVGHDYDEGGATASFAPVRLVAGGAGPLWSDATTGDYVFYTWGSGAGAAAYRHVDTLSEANQWSTLVTALDGGTGAGRWSLTSRP
jgi:hypothetical protein